jgi:anti-sigma regulatory factor (Ser/Thr protein kinase)
LEFWHQLFSGRGFMPRRLCGTWDDSLLALHIVSDAVIWLSYLWIPLVMLGSYWARRRTLRLQGPVLWVLALYVVFISACGWTHFFDALMFWHPVYRLNGLVRAATAVVSLATAVSLVKLVPRALTAPVTILTQQAALRQQHVWLRDILECATSGVLTLCETREELPAPLDLEPLTLGVSEASQLREVRHRVQALAESAGIDPSRTADLVTSVHEAAMNALVHAGSAAVHGCRAQGKVQVRIEDEGPGIPLDRLPIYTLKQGYSTAGTAGQGWYLILNFVDRAHLWTGAEGTTLVLEMGKEARPHALPFSLAVGGDVAA